MDRQDKIIRRTIHCRGWMPKDAAFYERLMTDRTGIVCCTENYHDLIWHFYEYLSEMAERLGLAIAAGDARNKTRRQ